MRNHRTGSGGPSPIKSNESSRIPARRPQLPPIDFKFPAAPPSANESNIRSAVSPSVASVDETAVSTYGKPTNNKDGSSLPVQGHLPQMTRIISNSSLNGSRRSSGELYSASNLSSDTLQSEYTNYSTPAPRAIPPRHMRHHSSVDPRSVLANSQTLLMGYAQISASFTVDGSLINQSAFEDVKRKGVVGGQGSGTGAPSNGASRGNGGRKGGGFWGALRWNNIEESLSGLLSNNDLDGLREMRGVSSSRSVPLLSTSQSLLFVDLRLAPGEEQSYSFSFTLPSGLPASHKGKAIKISYNLVIGTQRPSSSNEPQRVNRINVPFRVFSGVNGKCSFLSISCPNSDIICQVKGIFSGTISCPRTCSYGMKAGYKKSARTLPQHGNRRVLVRRPGRRRQSFCPMLTRCWSNARAEIYYSPLIHQRKSERSRRCRTQHYPAKMPSIWQLSGVTRRLIRRAVPIGLRLLAMAAGSR